MTCLGWLTGWLAGFAAGRPAGWGTAQATVQDGGVRPGGRQRLPRAGQHQGAGRRLRAARHARVPAAAPAGQGGRQLPVQHGRLQAGINQQSNVITCTVKSIT